VAHQTIEDTKKDTHPRVALIKEWERRRLMRKRGNPSPRRGREKEIGVTLIVGLGSP
jgi:hypothetical protein